MSFKLLEIGRTALVTAAICAATAATPSLADGIRWEKAKNIAGDADVRTDGVLRYAYANKAATVNGVAFAAGVYTGAFPNGVATMADVLLTASQKYIDTNAFATTVPAGASAGYLQLIRAGVFDEAETAEDPVTGTITLKNLIPGHAYLVQLWTNDSRADIGNYRYIKLDDTEEVRLRTSNGFGQHVTGAFTASSDSQSFTVVGYDVNPTHPEYKAVSQIASLQLRDVTPGQIEWEDAKNITDDADVRTDGECVFAAGWMAAAAVVNNVVFVPLSSTGNTSTTVYHDVRMTTENMSHKYVAGFNYGIAQTLSDDYHRLTGGSTCPLGGGENTTSAVTLDGLVPGGRYLVQLWVNDARSNIGPYRWQAVDGGRRMNYSVARGAHGQHITGMFTADGTSKSISLTSFYLYTETAKLESGAPQLNAIQLRRLDSGAATRWRVSPITNRDHDVRLDGELLYAYNFTLDANASPAINGVTFRGWKRPSASASTDDIAIALSSGEGQCSTSYGIGITDGSMSSGYKLMLQSMTYSDSQNESTPSTLTLKRLTPGHRYLVQLWTHDGRTEAYARNRYMDVDGVARLEYQNEGLFNPARGDVATGLFTATGTAHTVTMLSGDHSGAIGSVQLNGMQVRDLGEAADSVFNVWAGDGAWGTDAANWNDLAGEPREGTLWDAANGAGNVALFADAAGATVLPSGDLTAGGIVAAGALTVGAADDGKGVAAGFVEAKNCTFKSAWASDTLAKYDIGSFTLEGASPNLARVVTGGGTTTLARTDALKAGADVVVAGGATLALADGAEPVLSRLAGEGTLAFDGTITLTNESTQAFTGTLDGDVTVRKAGYGDWTLGGTHTGTLALDAREGTTVLVTDGAVVSVAEGAFVSLGGAAHSLGAVSGQGTITNGTVSSTLAVSDGSDITLADVVLSAGVTLNGASSVTFAGDTDLAGIAVHIADPVAASASRKLVVAVAGEMSGEPAFTFGARGYKARLAEGGGYTVYCAGFMLIVR